MLREPEAGAKTTEVCRKHGISGATFYKWKAKYGGMEVSDARRVKALEEENKAKSFWPTRCSTNVICREAWVYLRAAYGITERRACRIIGVDRASMRCCSRRPANAGLRERLRQLANECRRGSIARLCGLPASSSAQWDRPLPLTEGSAAGPVASISKTGFTQPRTQASTR